MSLKYFIIFFALVGCSQAAKLSSKAVLANENYESKTYAFSVFRPYNDSLGGPIDTANYSWVDTFRKGMLVSRFRPNFKNSSIRHDSYEYSDEGVLQRIRMVTTDRKGNTEIDIVPPEFVDMVLALKLQYPDTALVIKTTKTHSNDTTYVEYYGNGDYLYTAMEFWETQARKHVQIVKPKLSTVTIVHEYNDKGNLLKIERFKNGAFVSVSSKVIYKYDEQGRIVFKQTRHGSEDDQSIFSTEVTLYD